MNDEPTAGLPTNPFRSARVRPGAIPYLFDARTTPEQLVAHLRDQQWRGAIVGPHGSGKSTLLRTIEPLLESAGRRVVRFELHDGERSLPRQPGAPSLDARTIVIVDGYEQLSSRSRWLLRLRCWRAGCGLLVTSHSPVGLPTLYATRTDPRLAIDIVRALASGDLERSQISDDDIRAEFTLHSGNMREVLFRLYDVYRQRNAPGAPLETDE